MLLCPDCPTLREARALFAETFWENAVYVVMPIVLITVAVAWIVRRRLGPVVGAGVVLGVGLGGFFDGILLHQILQWHNMFSAVTPPAELVTMKYNMIWDGMFHALTWLACVVGVAMLFRAARRADAVWSNRLLVGSLFGGWGLFNFVEGVIDHLILGVHHVRPGEGQLAWDIGFVSLGGIGLALLGYFIARDVPTRIRAVATPDD